MDYAEASYFDGAHFQHIAAYAENNRMKAIDKANRQVIDRRYRQR